LKKIAIFATSFSTFLALIQASLQLPAKRRGSRRPRENVEIKATARPTNIHQARSKFSDYVCFKIHHDDFCGELRVMFIA